jgi:hypothetical protein
LRASFSRKGWLKHGIRSCIRDLTKGETQKSPAPQHACGQKSRIFEKDSVGRKENDGKVMNRIPLEIPRSGFTAKAQGSAISSPNPGSRSKKKRTLEEFHPTSIYSRTCGTLTEFCARRGVETQGMAARPPYPGLWRLNPSGVFSTLAMQRRQSFGHD